MPTETIMETVCLSYESNKSTNNKNLGLMAPFFYSSPQGTGSCPWPPQGLQLAIRFIVSHNPFKSPYFFKASIPYCEQVGVYRHCGPSHGEMINWYSLIRPINGNASRRFIFFSKVCNQKLL